MRKLIQTLGLIVLVMGISGTIDHLWEQPLLGWVLNAFNRYIIPKVDFLTGHELIANVGVGVVGIVVIAVGALVGVREKSKI